MVNHEIKDPTWVLETFDDFRTGGLEDLPPKFLMGTKGICNATLIVFHVCEMLGVEVSMIDEEMIDRMKLAPIMDRFGDIETLFYLCRELLFEE